MSGLSDTMKSLSPAYGLYKGMKSGDGVSSMGALSASPGGLLTGPLLNKDKKKKKAGTIASGY